MSAKKKVGFGKRSKTGKKMRNPITLAKKRGGGGWDSEM